MHKNKKDNQWYFGMKIHVGADVNSGLAHTVAVTAANQADVSQLPNLLREDDRAVFGDKGYVDNSLKRAARKAGVFWGVAMKSHHQAQADQSQPAVQPQDVLGPQPGGTSVPCGQAAIRLPPRCATRAWRRMPPKSSP